ncbi:hypothetical protein [Larkinella sp. C7]|uniref:hypothetical protein n=1 Tax=Larkinella sp. C7 TaxID=2576607 RepID=UPI001111061E|nr:hypothetical protein [Larkinella sp. C7]
MSFQTDYVEKFQNLALALSPDNIDQIRLTANGGNTVLFVYPPTDEEAYIQEAHKRYPNAQFIDVRQLLIDFIRQIGWADFRDYYTAYRSQPEVVFMDDGEEEKLFIRIITSIRNAIKAGQLPILVHTGALYGTGIDNVNIMQHPDVMRFDQPLIVFYPAIFKSETELDFLGVKPASKYRCKLVS